MSCLAPWKPWIVDWLCVPVTHRLVARNWKLGDLRVALHRVESGEQGGGVHAVANEVVDGGHGLLLVIFGSSRLAAPS
jgi:hypothetical protein